MDRKKELKELYKEMRPDMGILIIRSNANNKCYIENTPDLKSKINRTRFQLEAGSYPIKELQQDWKTYGRDSFTIEALEKLDYDKEDEAKTDYSEELELLKMVLEDKLRETDVVFYEK